MAGQFGIFAPNQPPLTDGQQVLPQVDSSGRLLVSIAGGGSNSSYNTPKGYQQLTSDQLATAQSLSVPAGAVRAVIQNNGAQAARWRADGTDPTATTGQRIIGGDSLDIVTGLTSYRFIREAEGVQLDIAYYA